MAEIETITIPELNPGFIKPTSFLAFSDPEGDMQKTNALDVAGMLNVKWYGAIGNDINDDTINIQAAINAASTLGAPLYLPKPPVRWLVSGIVIPSNVTIITDGFDTVIRQIPQSQADKRVIEIAGSNIQIGDMVCYGNISTDINEQNHFIYMRAKTSSYTNINIGNLKGINIRGDVLYLGANNPYTLTNVKVGNVYGSNILRNVVSITGGSNIDIQSIDGEKVGSLSFDVEPEPTNSAVDNVHVGFIRGRGTNLAAASANNPISNVTIDKLIISPSLQAQSEPAYYPELATGHGMVVRNLSSAKIGYFEAYGFSKCAIFTIVNPGELGCKYLKIDKINVHDCSLTDTQYNSFIQGTSPGVIEVGKGIVNITRSKSAFVGFDTTILSNIESTIETPNDLLVKDSNQVIADNIKVTGAGRMLRFIRGGTVNNSNFVGETVATVCSGIIFTNLTATVSADIFDASNRNNQVISSIVNGTPYVFGIDNPFVNGVGSFDGKTATVNGFSVGTDNKLYAQSASATRPGLVSTALQVFAGVKRFVTALAASAGFARGTTFEHSLSASANNDVLTGGYFGSSFTSGSFTGVKTYQIQAIGNTQLNSDNAGKVFFGTERSTQFGTGFELRGSGAIWNPGSSSYCLRLGFDGTSSVPSLQGYRETVGVVDMLLQSSGGNLGIGVTTTADKLTVGGAVKAASYKVTALGTAPASATATGTLGDIVYTPTYIYVCIATNTWVRTPLTTW